MNVIVFMNGANAINFHNWCRMYVYRTLEYYEAQHQYDLQTCLYFIVSLKMLQFYNFYP